MADLFISYRSLRQPAVRYLKRVLEAHGYSVWFDYGLLSGEEFAPVIERELRDAKAVIVIWCRYARESRWVKEEADLALNLQTYLPVRLDQSELPLGFRLQDTIDLSFWDGDPRGHGLDPLIEQIRRKTRRDPIPHYQTLVDLQQNWRDTGRIAWAALPIDERLGAEIEAKRAASDGRFLAGGGATSAQTPTAEQGAAPRVETANLPPPVQAPQAKAPAAQSAVEPPDPGAMAGWQGLFLRAGASATSAQMPNAATEEAPRVEVNAQMPPTPQGEAPAAQNEEKAHWAQEPPDSGAMAGWQGALRLWLRASPKWLLPGLAVGLMAVGLVFWHPWRSKAVEAPAVETSKTLPDIRAVRVQANITLQHEGAVESAAFSPDGTLIATASGDYTARIWRASDGALLATLKHEDSVYDATFSPDGRLIATASRDKTARIWRASDGALLATLKHGDAVRSAAFSPDGTLIATASYDDTARIWRVSDGALLATLKHKGGVWSAAFSPDGSLIATASEDNYARIWRVSDGALLATLKQGDFVFEATFSPDGRLIVTASDDKKARIWRVSDGALLATLQHGNSVGSAAFSPDGTRIATASEDNKARIWRASDGALLATLKHEGWVLDAVFSSDGSLIVTASWDYTARIWRASDGALLATLKHGDIVYDAAFSPDGTRIATASRDNTARIWALNVERK